MIQHCVGLLGALDLKPEVFAAGFDAGVVGALAASQQVALHLWHQFQPLNSDAACEKLLLLLLHGWFHLMFAF